MAGHSARRHCGLHWAPCRGRGRAWGMRRPSAC